MIEDDLTPGTVTGVLVLAALILLGALARFIDLGAQSLWFDEAHTVWVISTPVHELISRVVRTETTPPLFFLAAHLWARFLGSGAAALRSLSALCGVATIPVAYEAARRLMSRRAGVVAAALTTCNPLLVWYSQEARSYALLTLLSALTVLAVARLHEHHSRRWTAVWAASAVAALATHYYAALVVAPEAVWLLLRRRDHMSTRVAVAIVTVAAGGLAVLAHRQLAVLGPGNWIARVPLPERLADVPRTFLLGPHAPAEPVLLTLSILLTICGGLLASGTSPAERRHLAPAAKLVGAGCALVVLMLLAGYDNVDYRNLIPLWLPCAIVLAGCLASAPRRWMGAAITVALCGIGLATVTAVDLDSSLQRPPWKQLARALGDRPNRAIFMVNGCQLLPLTVYLPDQTYAPSRGERVRELDIVSAVGQRTWYQVYFSGSYAVCYRQPHDPRLPQRLAGLREVGGTVRIGVFRVVRLRSAVPRLVNSLTLALAGLHGELITRIGAASGT